MTNTNRLTLKPTSEKAERIQAIIALLQEEDFYTQLSMIEALEERKIFISQGTLSRYLQELNIEQADKGQPYQMTVNTLQTFHINELKALNESQSPTIYQNVSIQYLQTEKGKASQYAFHLQQAFPNVLLKVTIDMDSLIMLVNMDAETEAFFDVLQSNSYQ
ncbi:hypothetical protein [Sporosarcina ureae]|uniref:hypothetical protein n=1 Tax=Sporosarcina ureae TaxID=1571 RepID=UPI000A17D3E7|nr:hypothetical protein [Sporosarcina ureae]ARK22257.1 hypothetical protein SporoP32a_12410 [Sporosarcina ureae]